MGRPIKNLINIDKVSDIDLSWLAGIIEGEGWITIMHIKYITVGVANTDKILMNKVSCIFEHNLTIHQQSKNNIIKSNHTVYKCVLVGNRAKQLLNKIKPFMIGHKKDKIIKK